MDGSLLMLRLETFGGIELSPSGKTWGPGGPWCTRRVLQPSGGVAAKLGTITLTESLRSSTSRGSTSARLYAWVGLSPSAGH